MRGPLLHCLVENKMHRQLSTLCLCKVEFTCTVSLFTVSLKRKEWSIELCSFQSIDICALNYSITELFIIGVENVIIGTKHTILDYTTLYHNNNILFIYIHFYLTFFLIFQHLRSCKHNIMHSFTQMIKPNYVIVVLFTISQARFIKQKKQK